MKHLASCILYFVILLNIASAQSGLKKDYSIRSWTTDNGLPVNSIQAIAQTPEGFIWLGTEEGLVRFDGNSFFTFDPSNHRSFVDKDVHSLYVFPDSSLVIGFYHGDILSYKKLSFMRLFDREIDWIKCILSLAYDPGKGLWFGTDGLGLGHQGYDGKLNFLTEKDGLPNTYIQALLPAPDSSLWIGTRSGLCNLKNGIIKTFSTRDGLSHNDIRSLCFDANGNLWIGTNGGGISIFSKEKFSRFNATGNRLPAYILSLVKDSQEGIWIGTNSGLFRFTNGVLSGISTADGLSGNIISSIFEDREHTIWVGTEGSGLNALRRRSIHMLTADDGLSDNSIGPVIAGPGGIIYAGTGKGAVNAISSAGIRKLEKKIGLPSIPVNTLAFDSKGMLWIGTDGAGIYGYANDKVVHLTTADGLASDVIRALYVDSKGKLWAGVGNSGINVLYNGKIESINTGNGISHDQVLCFLEDSKGRMIVGTNGGGINILDEGKIKWLTTLTGMPDNIVLTLHEEEGMIWAGCAHGGLALIENDSVNIISEADGLYAAGILQILEDRNGRMWLSSNKGIISFPRNELIAYNDKKGDILHPLVYGIPEGMLSSECSGHVFPAGCISSENRLFIPTPKGLAELNAEDITPNSGKLQVILTQVLVNNTETDPFSPLVLDPGMVDIEFDYTSPSFLNPTQIQYKYMLEGFDHFWINAGSRRQAYYSHLPPGSYVFRVMAKGYTGRWTPEKRLFVLKIRPFFYRTSWFILTMALVLILITWFFLHSGMRRSREKMLKKLVEEKTLELNQEIERRKNAQEESNIARNNLEESDRLKSSVISFLNQYFRSPVNSIMGFSELMMEKKNAGEQAEIPKYIHDSGKEMIKMLDSVMLVAKIGSDEKGQEQLMDVLPLVEKSLLPSVDEPPGEFVSVEKQPPKTPRSGGKKFRLLLAEDNAINAELVKIYLSGKYELDIAADALSAVDMAGKVLYDAILMDINLGPGMDGIEATRVIKEISGYAEVPVIAVTGFTMAGMREKIMSGGASYFLAKPFGKNMLVDLLITVLPEEHET